MTSTNVKLLVPVAVAEPRGARWAGRAAAALANAAVIVWEGLQAQGRRRAGRQLLALADRVESNDPVLARQWREAGQSLLRHLPAAAEAR